MRLFVVTSLGLERLPRYLNLIRAPPQSLAHTHTSRIGNGKSAHRSSEGLVREPHSQPETPNDKLTPNDTTPRPATQTAVPLFPRRREFSIPTAIAPFFGILAAF
jgi:hypothetical protein